MTSYSECAKGQVGQSYDYGSAVVEGMQDSGIGGILSLLSAAIVVEGKDQSTGMQLQDPLVSIVIGAVRTLNNMAELNLKCVQATLGSAGFQGEVLHIFSTLLNLCRGRLTVGPDPGPPQVLVLISEVILLVGFYAVESEPNQVSLSYGTRSIITGLCDLPLEYFLQPKLICILFPTLIAATHGSERNSRLLAQVMSPRYLIEFMAAPENPSVDDRWRLKRRFPTRLYEKALANYNDILDRIHGDGPVEDGNPIDEPSGLAVELTRASVETQFREILAGIIHDPDR